MSSSILRRRLIATGIVIGAVAVLAVLVATRPKPERRKPTVPAPMVTVHRVDTEQPPITITGWGTVRPRRSITLVPQVGGRVVTVSENLRTGGFFAAGEVLVQIEDVDYQLALQQARREVAQAEFNLATAREEARVAREEWARTSADALNGSSLESAEPNPLVYREPQLRHAEAGLEAARAALAQAELNLDRCRITAPFAGRVLDETVDTGQYVRTGEVLGRIYDTDVAEITVNLADRDLAWVAVPRTPDDETEGSPATVSATFAGGEHAWPGRAVRVGGAIDDASRTVPVVVEVADPYAIEGDRPPLLSGMFVAVTFASDAPAGAVTIPRKALRGDGHVWLLDGENRLVIRDVTVARAGVEHAVIGAGLAPGDRVITSNLQYVVEGMTLRTNGMGGGQGGGAAAAAGQGAGGGR